MNQAKAARAALMEYPMVAPAGHKARGEEIVAFLNKVWVVPQGLRECDPCRAGLDRQTIEDPAFRSFGG
jgi:hypothetical protein